MSDSVIDLMKEARQIANECGEGLWDYYDELGVINFMFDAFELFGYQILHFADLKSNYTYLEREPEGCVFVALANEVDECIRKANAELCADFCVVERNRCDDAEYVFAYFDFTHYEVVNVVDNEVLDILRSRGERVGRVTYSNRCPKKQVSTNQSEQDQSHAQYIPLEEFLANLSAMGEDAEGDVGIDALDLTVRSYNCLKRAQIYSLRQLMTYSEAELLATRKFFPKSVQEIKEQLEAIGLKLKD